MTEHADIEKKFLECVQQHPGMTAEEIAEEIHVPVRFVRQACAYCLGTGALCFSDDRYFVVEVPAPVQDPFFVAVPVPAPKLPDLTPPTEAGLDGWEFFFALLKEQHGLTREQFVTLPPQAQATIQDATQAFEIMAWFSSTDAVGYVRAPENFAVLAAWVTRRNAPITKRNLTQAFKAIGKTREQITKEELERIQKDHDKDKWLN
jgi:hypothetical protein